MWIDRRRQEKKFGFVGHVQTCLHTYLGDFVTISSKGIYIIRGWNEHINYIHCPLCWAMAMDSPAFLEISLWQTCNHGACIFGRRMKCGFSILGKLLLGHQLNLFGRLLYRSIVVTAKYDMLVGFRKLIWEILMWASM